MSNGSGLGFGLSLRFRTLHGALGQLVTRKVHRAKWCNPHHAGYDTLEERGGTLFLNDILHRDPHHLACRKLTGHGARLQNIRGRCGGRGDSARHAAERNCLPRREFLSLCCRSSLLELLIRHQADDVEGNLAGERRSCARKQTLRSIFCNSLESFDSVVVLPRLQPLL